MWEEVCQTLRAAPERTAKLVFQDLQARYPGRYTEGQLRTLQRQVGYDNDSFSLLPSARAFGDFCGEPTLGHPRHSGGGVFGADPTARRYW